MQQFLTASKEHGSILFTTLILLLVITMIAIGSTRLSTAGQRISFNYQMKNTSFQAADSALVEAVEQLANSPVTETFVIELPPQKDPQTGNNIISTVNVERTRVAVGDSLSVTAPKTFAYKMISQANISGLNIETELEQGFLKPDVGGN